MGNHRYHRRRRIYLLADNGGGGTMNVICNLRHCPHREQCFHGKPHKPDNGCKSTLCGWFKIKNRRQRCECIPVPELQPRENILPAHNREVKNV